MYIFIIFILCYPHIEGFFWFKDAPDQVIFCSPFILSVHLFHSYLPYLSPGIFYSNIWPKYFFPFIKVLIIFLLSCLWHIERSSETSVTTKLFHHDIGDKEKLNKICKLHGTGENIKTCKPRDWKSQIRVYPIVCLLFCPQNILFPVYPHFCDISPSTHLYFCVSTFLWHVHQQLIFLCIHISVTSVNYFIFIFNWGISMLQQNALKSPVNIQHQSNWQNE